MSGLQDQVWDALASLGGEAVLRAFTDYHGTQILSKDFADFLAGEGLLGPAVTGREDEDEDE
jgi:hypothetical protein